MHITSLRVWQFMMKRELIRVTVEGITIDFRRSELANASSNSFTPSGISTETRAGQLPKALSPIVMMEDGRATDVKYELPRKAFGPMAVTAYFLPL